VCKGHDKACHGHGGSAVKWEAFDYLVRGTLGSVTAAERTLVMAKGRNPNSRQRNNSGQGKPNGLPMGGTGFNANLLDETEIILTVCELYLEGMSCNQIVRWMKEHYNVGVAPRAPLKYLRKAAQRGWIKLHPPGFFQLRTMMRKKYGWLEGLEVVHSTRIDHVAQRGAVVLRRLVTRQAHAEENKHTVHIGIPGGAQTRKLVREFAKLLCEPAEDWPEEIVIHGMVPGVKLEDPFTDPKAMFLSLLDDFPDLQVKLRVVSFPAPGLVDTDQIDVDGLKSWDDIRSVMAEAARLDIIVTSAGNWADEHSVFSQIMKSSPKAFEKLMAEGVVGDFLWRPVNKNGPIEADTGLRFMTLVELAFLPGFIARGKKVLCLLGPCEQCLQPKAEIAIALLELRDHLFTHLVVDSRTARGAIKAA
jgi:hypothetical protein